MSIFEQKETEEARLERLMTTPKSADAPDVVWLAARVQFLDAAVTRARTALAGALKGDGRFAGLREAAEIVDAASRKSVLIRVSVGAGFSKREKTSRAVNEKLLQRVANLLRQYAADAESGRLDEIEARARQAAKDREALQGPSNPAPEEPPAAAGPEAPEVDS